jgi:hypothetical protein
MSGSYIKQNYKYNTLGVPVILHQVYVEPHNLPKGVCSLQDIVLVSGYYPHVEQSKG